VHCAHHPQQLCVLRSAAPLAGWPLKALTGRLSVHALGVRLTFAMALSLARNSAPPSGTPHRTGVAVVLLPGVSLDEASLHFLLQRVAEPNAPVSTARG
jgi:hypothetical protein